MTDLQESEPATRPPETLPRRSAPAATQPAATHHVVSRPSAPSGRRALLVGSSGGHLSQLAALTPLWSPESRAWVTFDTADALSLLEGERVWWAYRPTTRNVRNLLRNAVLAFRVLREHRPEVVLSTGAGVAVPFFVLARIMGIPTVYVEVFDRIDSATLTGRLCRPLSTVFCVQWEQQRQLYRRTTMVGPLL